MKAIILAAGQGNRLLPLTKDTPKCLLNISGTSILEYQLVTLASCGINDVVIIGGFRMDKLSDYAHRYAAIHGLNLKLKMINNTEYYQTNNLYSLWLARNEMTTDFLVINGDNVFERNALIKVMKHSQTEATVAIHRQFRYDNEDMKVRIQGPQVVEISKSIDNFAAHGESIGLRAFRHTGVEAFRQAVIETNNEDENRQAFFVKAIQRMIDRGHQVGYVDVSEYKYGELDFPGDLVTLEKEMAPLMLRNLVHYSNPASLYARTLRSLPQINVKKAG